MTTRTISQLEYDAFRGFLEKTCGIVLGDNRHYLVTSRLGRLMADYSVSSFNDLIKIANSDRSVREQILDAMTTNETSWFRDNYPYDLLADEMLPQLCAQRGIGPLRIWSAACSAGHEPYSISIIIDEFQQKNPGLLRQNVEIIATDISPAMIKMAQQGIYDSIALSRGLSGDRKKQYFERLPNHENQWQVRKTVRDRIKFRTFNLMDSYSLHGKFDIVFCRNVLIYFSNDLKKDILSRIAKAMQPGGYLLLGGSETISGYSNDFEMLRGRVGTLYRLR